MKGKAPDRFCTDPDLAARIEKRVADGLRVAPGDLERQFAASRGVDRKTVRRAVRELVDSGALMYTYTFGTSYLEPGLSRPYRLTERIVVVPPRTSFIGSGQDVLMTLQHGVSFGTGVHPTTRLTLRAMETALKADVVLGPEASCRALDVGTGSGILAIAAVKMGIPSALGLDTDPCAVFEARENVRLNVLEDKVEITDRHLSAVTERFALVTANLRSPTLGRMLPDLAQRTSPGGLLLLSGIRSGEEDCLVGDAEQRGLRVLDLNRDKGWVCVALSTPLVEVSPNWRRTEPWKDRKTWKSISPGNAPPSP